MSDPAEMRMFDLGLAKGIEIGEERAKERIIKLLDEAKTYQQLELAIALIKGEK